MNRNSKKKSQKKSTRKSANKPLLPLIDLVPVIPDPHLFDPSQDNIPTGVVRFSTAFKYLKIGCAIKRIHWRGYWKREMNDVVMYCKDGSIVRMSQGCDPIFTIENILADDWMVLTNSEVNDFKKFHDLVSKIK